jgi:hypothetical protein
MFTPEQLLEIAQTVQSKIRDLLSPEEADRIEPELTHLIQQLQNGQPVAKQLLLLLKSQKPFQPYLTQINRGATPPGNPPPIPASQDTPSKGIPPKTDNPTQK